MVAVLRLLDRLLDLGIQLDVSDGRLRTFPKGAVPPDLGAELRAHRDEIVALVERTRRRRLVADGRDILAALGGRGIAVRLNDEGVFLARPAELLDEADRALLSTHRDAVLAALQHEVPDGGPDAAAPADSGDQERPDYGPGDANVLSFDGPPCTTESVSPTLAAVDDTNQLRQTDEQPGARMDVACTTESVSLTLRAVEDTELARQPIENVGGEDQSLHGDVNVSPPLQGVNDQRLSRQAEDDLDGSQASHGVAPSVSPTLPSVDADQLPLQQTAGDRDGQPALGAPHLRDDLRAEPPGGREGGPSVAPGRQAFEAKPAVITSAADLEGTVSEVLAAPLVGLDLETTGLDPLSSSIRLVQLATTRDRAWVVDAGQFGLGWLQPVLDQARCLAGHNLKFEFRFLQGGGLVIPDDVGRRLCDTFLASQLLDAGRPEAQRKGSKGEEGWHSLGSVARRHVGLELRKELQSSDWRGDLSQDQLRYAATDAAVMLPLVPVMRRHLEASELTEIAAIEHGALPAVAWLEQAGAPIDQERWCRPAELAKERRRQLERELEAVAPSPETLLPIGGLEDAGDTRWNSPKQICRALEERGVGLPDTEEETLHKFAHRDPLIPLLLQYREVAKLCDTYGPRFLKHVHPATGRIHAEYHQLGADTGRMSCSHPNLQQIPHDEPYRASFRPPEGRVLVKSDFSQIEARLAAEIAQDAGLLEAFERGEDVYLKVARELSVERKTAKTIVLGALYGLGARGLRTRLKVETGAELSEKQARRYLDGFFGAYRGLNRWRNAFPRDHPVDTRTPLGRRRLRVPDYTQKINSPIQGAAADGFKIALGRLFETRGRVPSAVPVLIVHDEIVVECDREGAAQALAWVTSSMREGMGELLHRVPVEVEAAAGLDWSMSGPLPELAGEAA